MHAVCSQRGMHCIGTCAGFTVEKPDDHRYTYRGYCTKSEGWKVFRSKNELQVTYV